MALRTRASRVLLDAAAKSETAVSAQAEQAGLRGFVDRLRERFSTGKILRLDVEDDILRQPVDKSKYRFPSPGAQQTPVVPQGPYNNVFDITYHNRDSRRRTKREQVTVTDARSAGLPPTPGTPVKTTFLGMMGDFDRQE